MSRILNPRGPAPKLVVMDRTVPAGFSGTWEQVSPELPGGCDGLAWRLRLLTYAGTAELFRVSIRDESGSAPPVASRTVPIIGSDGGVTLGVYFTGPAGEGFVLPDWDRKVLVVEADGAGDESRLWVELEGWPR